MLCATINIWQVVNESATGSKTSKRVRLSLTIAVERVDFDSKSCLLRLSGRNSEENPHVKVISDTHAVYATNTVSTADVLWMTKHLPRSPRDAQQDKPNKRPRVSHSVSAKDNVPFTLQRYPAFKRKYAMPSANDLCSTFLLSHASLLSSVTWFCWRIVLVDRGLPHAGP